MHADDFRALYLRYFNRLLEFAYGIVRSRDVALDVVQDVFASIWERGVAWQTPDRPEVYLYQSVRYRALYLLRHHRMAATKEPLVQSDDSARREEQTPHAERTTELRDAEQRVLDAIEQLPDAQREAILLHWRHGLSNPEIATVMQRSTGAVAVYVSRARETLRTTLADLL